MQTPTPRPGSKRPLGYLSFDHWSPSDEESARSVLLQCSRRSCGRSLASTWRSAAPDAFGTFPPTDGAGYHVAGVPVVNLLAAPFYLFDKMDTLDKIDRDHLVPITRATIRIIESVRAETAAGLRARVG